jgi:hypothetical protein
MMTMSFPHSVARLAFDPTVRRAVQSLPQHAILKIDDRFNELLERLSEGENEFAPDVGAPEAFDGPISSSKFCLAPRTRASL